MEVATIPRVSAVGYWNFNSQSKIAAKWLRWMCREEQLNVTYDKMRTAEHADREYTFRDPDTSTLIYLDGYLENRVKYCTKDLYLKVNTEIPLNKSDTGREKAKTLRKRKELFETLKAIKCREGAFTENPDECFEHIILEFNG